MTLKLLLIICLAAASPVLAADSDYGAKGIYPVYENSGQWLIYNKRPADAEQDSWLGLGQRFLVIGSRGEQIFKTTRTSAMTGGTCHGTSPVKLPVALLRGPRSQIGSPIIGIKVPPQFQLSGSNAVYQLLKNEVTDQIYQQLEDVLKAAVIADIKSGNFKPDSSDPKGEFYFNDPRPNAIRMTIDFGAKMKVKGLKNPFVFVTEAALSQSTRRCLRLADGNKLIGDCVEMPRKLMAETELLQFVSYDPHGDGSNPYLLGYTRTQPLWGDERWGFVIKPDGPKAFILDAMDVRCREGF